MKAIKLSKREKSNGIYSFYDGSDYRKFTNRRKYVSAITQHEKAIQKELNHLLNQNIEMTLTTNNPARDLRAVAQNLMLMASVYEFGSRGLPNDLHYMHRALCDVKDRTENKKEATY